MRRFFGIWLGAYRGLPGYTWFLAVVTLINRAGTMVVPFVSIYVSKELGLGVLFAGQAMASFGAGGMVGTLGGGWLTDKLGARKVIYLSLIGSGGVLWSLQYLYQPLPLLAGMFLLGLVGESYRPAVSTALAESCPIEKRMRAFALNRTAINIGMALGPAVGGFLAEFDYAWLFRLDGITCLSAGLLVLFAMREQPETAADEVRSATPVDPSGKPPWRDAAFMGFSAMFVVFACIVFQAFSTYPIYLESVYGLSESGYGLLMTINAVIITLVEMPLTHAVEKKSPLWIIAWGVILFSLGLGILPLGSGFTFAVFSLLIWTTGEMLTAPASMTFVAELAGEKHRGRYMGVFSMTFGAGHMIGPLLGALIYDRWGPDALWLGIAGLGVVLGLAFPRLKRFGKTEPAARPAAFS